jgi:hypothetical protein
MLTTLHYGTLPYPHSTSSTIMTKTCIMCSAVASPDLQLQYCATCQSALYCSRACQRIDWQKQHKKICKLLNVGHGDMQVRTEEHTSLSIESKEEFEMNERNEEAVKHFFKLFEESTFEGSRAAALEMRKFAKVQSKQNQKFLFFHGLHSLIRSSNPEILSWPNSPFLVMLQFVDPTVLSGDCDAVLEEGVNRVTPLDVLGDLADPFDHSTHVNQLILAKKLIEHGANVNGVSIPHRKTPLHNACSAYVVTNLDFVEYLLDVGADPNAQDHLLQTPLMCTVPDAPGAAKFLLNWPTTDANITTRSGASFLARVRLTITCFSGMIALPHNSEQVQHQFKLQQWREIEEMLVERGAADTGITALIVG